jgi:hypothetical protein
MGKSGKGLRDFAKQMDESQKALERTRIAASAFKGAPGRIRPEKVQNAIDSARELADSMNAEYSIEKFHPNKVTIDRKRYEAMEKVISLAMVVCDRGTNKPPDKDVQRLRTVVNELLLYNGDREAIIASLLQMEEALSEQNAASEHSV